MTRPILYSFRRCPYAMRARLSLFSAGIETELREIILRDKASDFVRTSPKATVPVLVTNNDIIEESRDIMMWALGKNDPEYWLDMPAKGYALIDESDGPFKTALDRYKYHARYDCDRVAERNLGATFLRKLDGMLAQGFLLGSKPRLADRAIQPFVRQYANTDRAWFDAQPWPNLHRWLLELLDSPQFAAIMRKYPAWSAGDPLTIFPEPAPNASQPSLSDNGRTV